MTQHVRTGYRKHRRATWAGVLVVAIVVALAATVLPAMTARRATRGSPRIRLECSPVE